MLSQLPRIVTYLLIVFVFSIQAQQQYFFKNYSPENGLNFVQSACMYQDDQGYLWAGGYGGLTRFNGTEFVYYSPKNGLIDHNVTAIFGDEKGRIYVGTVKGLSVIDKRIIQNFNKGNGLLNEYVTTLLYTSKNEMLIGTKSGLYTMKEQRVKEVSEFKGYKINALIEKDNKLFVATDKGLIIRTTSGIKIIDNKNGLPTNEVTCVAYEKDNLIIGTAKGLCFYGLLNGKITTYLIENGLIDENITSLLKTQDGLWIGSNTGLLKFKGNEFSYYNIGYDNNSNLVKCLVEDREGNIWVGTHSGIFRYRDNSFSTFDKVSGPGNAFIFQIFRDKNGVLWLCSDNNGIYKYDQGYFKRYGSKEGLKTNVCRAGIQDSDGRLIFGTKNGVVQFKNEHFYDIPLPKEFEGTYEMLLRGRDGRTWIAGNKAVASLTWKNNSPQIRCYPLPVKTDCQVYALQEDDEGNLLIGTEQMGLFKLIGDSIHHYSQELGLQENNYFAIRCYKGFIFSACLNGLYVINSKDGTSSYITEQDGLNSELVYSLEFADNKRMLWIGTNQGINKFDLKRYLDDKTINIVSYGKQQGFMGVECNSNGIWEDRDGSLWFGTVSGLVKHEPFNFKPNRVRNTTLIERIKLFSDDTLLNNNAILSSGFNTITFYYKGICLTNPEKVLYVKKLDGLEKEWSSASKEEYSKYANLAPGKYTFRVKSCNNEGVWDDHETTFTFTILQPFYTTWWFILLVVLGISGIIYTSVLLRIRNIKRKQRLEYERKVEMSKVELKALRSQMNPHFIFNSLNSIQHYIYNSKSEEAIKYLSKFARLVRIILNNSNKPTVTIGEDLEALKLYLELEKMRFEDKFDYEIIIDPSVDVDYDIMPPLLTQPYVENAILHGLNPKPGKGKLSISFNSKNNFLICTITDNGIGREKAAEIKRTMPQSKHKSLGMKITEDRLKILNEVNNSQLSVNIIDLKDEKGYSLGTTVELYVPING